MCKKALILSLLLIMALTTALPAAAQDNAVTFSSLKVDLWPEYDHPDILVMYLFSLAPQVSVPRELTLRVPPNATVNAVAVCEPDGPCYDTPYQQSTQGPWKVLTIQASMPDLRIEYYDPGLKRNGTQRSYTYTWPGDYAIDSVKITVQQPLNASSLELKPGTFTPLQVTDDPLSYYQLDAGSLAAGQAITIEMNYQKPDDSLSANNSQVLPSEPLDSTASGRASLTSALPIVLGLVGVLMMVGGGWWYWHSGRQSPSVRRERRPRRRSGAAAASVPGEAVYCQQCGKRANSGDRFCRTCGAELRL